MCNIAITNRSDFSTIQHKYFLEQLVINYLAPYNYDFCRGKKLQSISSTRSKSVFCIV